MNQKAQDLKEQGADSQLLPGQEVKDQAPVHQQTSPFAAAQSGDVGIGEFGMDDLLGIRKGRDLLQPWIRHINDGGMHFDSPTTGDNGLIATGQYIKDGGLSRKR